MKFCERWFTEFNHPNKTPISDPVRNHATVTARSEIPRSDSRICANKSFCLAPPKGEFSSWHMTARTKPNMAVCWSWLANYPSWPQRPLQRSGTTPPLIWPRMPECEFRTLQIDICKMNLIYTQSQIQTHVTSPHSTCSPNELLIWISMLSIVLFLSFISRRASSWYL